MKLTPEQVKAKTAELDSGELPDVFEEVPDRDSPWYYQRMFPELLCKHGFNKLTCYSCAPLPEDEEKPIPEDSGDVPF